jgi:hypothetical protein
MDLTKDLIISDLGNFRPSVNQQVILGLEAHIPPQNIPSNIKGE